MSAQKKDGNKSFIIINKNGYSFLGNIYLIKSIGSTPSWLNTSELKRLWKVFAILLILLIIGARLPVIPRQS